MCLVTRAGRRQEPLVVTGLSIPDYTDSKGHGGAVSEEAG